MDRNATGAELAEEIGREINRDPLNLRLISNGKVIKVGEGIDDQNLKPGAVIMVLHVNRNDESLKVLAEQQKILENTKCDAELLGDEDDVDDDYQLQIAGIVFYFLPRITIYVPDILKI